jgi:hypothetical protein
LARIGQGARCNAGFQAGLRPLRGHFSTGLVWTKRSPFAPVTLGHIRSHGCRDLLVYCISGRCHHSATLNGDWLSDETPVRSLRSRMVCTRCGMIGADVRPDLGPHVNKRRV